MVTRTREGIMKTSRGGKEKVDLRGEYNAFRPSARAVALEGCLPGNALHGRFEVDCSDCPVPAAKRVEPDGPAEESR